jgi:hypothetical protein
VHRFCERRRFEQVLFGEGLPSAQLLQRCSAEQRLGLHRPVTERRSLVGESGGERQPFAVLARVLERLGARELGAQRLHAASRLRIGRRTHRRSQRRRVRTRGEVAEAARCLHRAGHQLRVRVAEEVHERAHLLAPLPKTLHAQVEELLRLLAAHPRGLACFAPHGHPATRVPAERLHHRRERALGVRFAGGAERAVHRLPARLVPHPVELMLRSGARPRPMSRADPVALHEREHRRHARGPEQPAPPDPRRVAAERLEENLHRRKALARLDPQTPEEHRPQPRRHLAAGGGIADLAARDLEPEQHQL